MKRLITILLSIFSVLLLSAQIQYGYVKTKGRLGADGNVIPGIRLSGATVSIKDRSALISASDGAFSFPLPGKSYIVKNVRKNGYLLTDAEQLRSYGYSSNPLILVMETPEQQNEDRLMAEIKINRTLRSTIRQREEELDSLRAANRITKEEYHKLNAQLNTDEERNRKLIDEMVERYAKMDFDQMDERNREIKACILNGELLKADSLINSKGDLDARIREYIRLREANAREAEELKKRSETLASSRTIEEKTLLELAEDCFNKSDMFKMGHQNDSAAYYLAKRAELDTTNVQWQLEAGRFLDYYLAAYNKALDYYNRALRHALMKSGEKSSDVATCYNDIGYRYFYQGDYVKSLEYNEKSLFIRLLIFGEYHPDVALSYNNMGGIYDSMGDYAKALEYYDKALSIELSVYGSQNSDIAVTYSNIGGVYFHLGDYVKALEYYESALVVMKKTLGEYHPNVATSYNKIGNIYSEYGDYTKALEYCKKALTIQLLVLGEYHPNVATSYNYISNIYFSQGNYVKALKYYEKALVIKKEILGDNHPDVATIYNNIGLIYFHQGDYIKALEYCEKTLVTQLEIYGDYHPDVALSYFNIALSYYSQNDYSKALDFLIKSLNIYTRLYDHNNIKSDICLKYIYKSYCGLLQQSDQKKKEFEEFISEYSFTIDIVEGETPASSQGMSGQYYLLEFGDWNIYSTKNLFDKNTELQGKPKVIVVIKDGVITKHHFEDKIGCQIGIKYVGKEEKQRIVESYNKWKKE